MSSLFHVSNQASISRRGHVGHTFRFLRALRNLADLGPKEACRRQNRSGAETRVRLSEDIALREG